MERIWVRIMGVKLEEGQVGLPNPRLGANRSPSDTQLRRLKKIALVITVIKGRRKIFPTPRRMMVMRREKKVLTLGTFRWMILKPRCLMEKW